MWRWSSLNVPGYSPPYNAPKVRFSATLEEEPEVEVGLV
jgi:hypothetical protein